MDLPAELDDSDLCDADLSRHLTELVTWGEEQRRDALRSLMACLPQPLLIEVIEVLVGQPDFSRIPVIDKDT